MYLWFEHIDTAVHCHETCVCTQVCMLMYPLFCRDNVTLCYNSWVKGISSSFILTETSYQVEVTVCLLEVFCTLKEPHIILTVTKCYGLGIFFKTKNKKQNSRQFSTNMSFNQGWSYSSVMPLYLKNIFHITSWWKHTGQRTDYYKEAFPFTAAHGMCAHADACVYSELALAMLTEQSCCVSKL